MGKKIYVQQYASVGKKSSQIVKTTVKYLGLSVCSNFPS